MNYADAFEAFIRNTTEEETQGLWLQAVVNAVVDHHLLAGKTVMVLDIGCGPGANSLFLRGILDERQIAHRILGCDQNTEHLVTARNAINRSGDQIIEGDIFDSSFDFLRAFNVGAVDLAVLSHSGYYAPAPDALEDLIGRIDSALSETGVLLSLHKAEEPTNAVKRKFEAIVESETTERLHEIFSDRKMACAGNTLEAKLKFPSREQGDGDLMRAIATAQIVSFLGHRNILQLGNKDIKIYLDMLDALRNPQGEIKTFIQADMICSSKAKPAHQKLIAAINELVGAALRPQLPLPFSAGTHSL